jgi:hypothetical protein
MTKNKVTIDDLALMIQKGFTENRECMDRRFDEVDNRFDKIEVRLDNLEKDFKEIKE